MRSPFSASRQPLPGAPYWASLVKPALSRDLHRPADRATLRAAAVELASRGLTARDIAGALHLSEAAVRVLISAPSDSRTLTEIP